MSNRLRRRLAVQLGRAIIRLGALAHPSQQGENEQGQASRAGGADGGGQLQSLDERRPSRLDQLSAEQSG